jgi:hypothetical protein
MRRSPLAAALAIVLLAGPAFGQPSPSDAASLERMRADLFFLAGPECEGRGVETKGIELAADHIAKQLKDAGLKPAGKDGTYFQPFPMAAFPEKKGKSTLAFAGPDGAGFTPAEEEDFRPTGHATGRGKVAAGVVFVGHGITAPNLKYDDYAGIDVAGKWVVIVRRTPRPQVDRDGRFDTATPPGELSPYAALRLKVETAAEKKAAGVLIVSDPETAGDNDTLMQFNSYKYDDIAARLPVVHLTRVAASKLLKGGLGKTLQELEAEIDKDLKPRSAELKGWTATGDIAVERRDLTVKNVVGCLEGSGPLAGETVVVGAHYDHVGYGSGRLSMGGEAAQGKIHFGADDNASGTTAVLELARRFAAMKDRRGRRLVFILFSGEERGLVGSKFYCEHPLFPLNKTVAMVNLDMVGRMRPGPGDWLGVTSRPQIQFWGTGSGDTFDRTVDAVERRYELRVKKLPSGTGPSDHDSFYRKKVPVLFLFTDFHPDYHRPSDTPDKINLPGMVTVVNATEDVVLDLSTAVAPPRYAEVVEDDPHAGAGPKIKQGVFLKLLPDYNYMGGDGMRVEGVTAGGPAEKAGLKPGDVVTEIDGVPVRSVPGYMSALGAKKPGDTLTVTVLRGGKKMELQVKP